MLRGFQIAVAIMAGLRFVVIDRADILDEERRKMLAPLLLNSMLDQAIVLLTSEESPPLPGILHVGNSVREP